MCKGTGKAISVANAEFRLSHKNKLERGNTSSGLQRSSAFQMEKLKALLGWYLSVALPWRSYAKFVIRCLNIVGPFYLNVAEGFHSKEQKFYLRRYDTGFFRNERQSYEHHPECSF